MKNVLFLALLLTGALAVKSQSITPENTNDFVALLNVQLVSVQSEWSMNSQGQSSDYLASIGDGNNTYLVTTGICVCNVTATNSNNGRSFTTNITLDKCLTDEGCQGQCDKWAAGVNSGGPITVVVNSATCK